MEEKKYLNEENYQKTKKKLITISIIILSLGILIGGGLIATGLIKQSKINSQYSEESKSTKLEQLNTEKQKITQELDSEKQNLITSKTTIENKIKPVEDEIKKLEREPFKGFDDAYYAREDKIKELKNSIESDKKSITIIEDVLDESFEDCNFSSAKNNTYTSQYCSIKKQLKTKEKEISNLDYEFSEIKKSMDSHDNITFYIIGGFIILCSCGFSSVVYIIAKRREIEAFTAQQTIPVAKEVVEETTPTMAKAAGTIGKEIAKGIAEGLKEGLDDKEN